MTCVPVFATVFSQHQRALNQNILLRMDGFESTPAAGLRKRARHKCEEKRSCAKNGSIERAFTPKGRVIV